MDPAQRDARELTDEEAIRWMQELVTKLAGEKGCAGKACALEALRNPVRREILAALWDRPLGMDEVSARVGITGSALKYHLSLLRSSYFIETQGDRIDLTPGGVSVVRGYERT